MSWINYIKLTIEEIKCSIDENRAKLPIHIKEKGQEKASLSKLSKTLHTGKYVASFKNTNYNYATSNG